MKVIDLLNMIANDIDVPPKNIKYNDKYFEYKLWLEPDKYAYVEKGTNNTLEEYCCFYDLNDEVEIIEDKKIEKIENKIDTTFENYNYSERMRLTEIVNKINEIIDKINKEKNNCIK